MTFLNALRKGIRLSKTTVHKYTNKDLCETMCFQLIRDGTGHALWIHLTKNIFQTRYRLGLTVDVSIS